MRYFDGRESKLPRLECNQTLICNRFTGEKQKYLEIEREWTHWINLYENYFSFKISIIASTHFHSVTNSAFLQRIVWMKPSPLRLVNKTASLCPFSRGIIGLFLSKHDCFKLQIPPDTISTFSLVSAVPGSVPECFGNFLADRPRWLKRGSKPNNERNELRSKNWTVKQHGTEESQFIAFPLRSASWS